MKTKYSMFGILAIITLVMSFIVPGNLANPSAVSANDPGICKWNYIDVPGSGSSRQIVTTATMQRANGTEVEKLVMRPNGEMLAVVRDSETARRALAVFPSSYKGVGWSSTVSENFITSNGFNPPYYVWDVAIAPDDNNFFAFVTSGHTTGSGGAADIIDGPYNVWVTTNGGATFENTKFNEQTNASFIGAISISPSYGSKRDIAVGVRTGAGNGTNNIWVLQTGGFAGWKLQTTTSMPDGGGTAITSADILALKFSPTYVGDAALGVVFSTSNATYFNTALRDLSSTNDITAGAAGWAFAYSVEVKNSASIAGVSAGYTDIVSADLELPADFSGQSASLRRAYISIDAAIPITDNATQSGVYRIDDTTVYTLMDTTSLDGTSANYYNGKRINSIAYFGTYASGKLLVGEVNGTACDATVPTWFTDSPTVCPVPCWYPALKPTTGAAGNCYTTGTGTARGGKGYGYATVIWNPDGTLAYAATSSLGLQSAAENATGYWWSKLDDDILPRDESAIAISRNNGETWNQIGFIDTYIYQFTDVAPTADCQTIYLASTNNYTSCQGFDSVWRASKNSKVVSPLTTATPLGYWWERVFTHQSGTTCSSDTSTPSTDLLRLPPAGANCDNGMVVGWAVYGTKAQAWSPDYGDYWAHINPRNNIQDFAFESPTLLYNLSSTGLVQKMPYTGTAWSTAEADINTGIVGAHMITVQPVGKVAVAGSTGGVSAMVASIDGGQKFTIAPPDSTLGAYSWHAAFDPAFDTNKTFYLATSGGGSTYRFESSQMAGSAILTEGDMMSASNGAIGSNAPHDPLPSFYGIQTAFTGGALYVAHDIAGAGIKSAADTNSGVDRTLWPLAGMPKPGIYWDDMSLTTTTNHNPGVLFTAEPWSLKICGCCTLDTSSKLWALDNRQLSYNNLSATYGTLLQGFLWAFDDCLAKKGPALITADGTLIGCDPVSGRAQEVNLCWEQLCVANRYDIEIAKDKGFTIRILDWVSNGTAPDEVTVATEFLAPVDTLKPCVFFPAGGSVSDTARIGSAIAASGNLECGHKYFWRVQVRTCATGQIIRSQWSGINSFTVKAGLPVRADYYGLKLLAPDNGCLGCPVKPASFSWSPFKETTKYKFVLAKTADMTQVVAEAEVPTTAYEYKGNLDYSTNYFWRVMSLTPAPSDWSATFSFQTEPKPAAPSAPAEAPATPLWVWVIIAIGAILIIVTLVLIFKTRRV